MLAAAASTGAPADKVGQMSTQHTAAEQDAPAHRTVLDRRGKPFDVLDELPHLDPERALATVELPLHVYWSGPRGPWQLAVKAERVEAYRTLLREGLAEDIAQFVDGDLLVDAWDGMFLPREIRAAWKPLIDAAKASTQ